jgi:hypothetical protein
MSKRIPKDPTLQQLYNYVARHLLSQKARAYDVTAGGCVLRDEAGRACAIGCLIAPGAFVGVREDECSPRVRDAICEDLGVSMLYKQTLCLLRDLRRVHDHYPVDLWPSYLQHVAAEHGLKPIGDQP